MWSAGGRKARRAGAGAGESLTPTAELLRAPNYCADRYEAEAGPGSPTGESEGAPRYAAPAAFTRAIPAGQVNVTITVNVEARE